LGDAPSTVPLIASENVAAAAAVVDPTVVPEVDVAVVPMLVLVPVSPAVLVVSVAVVPMLVVPSVVPPAVVVWCVVSAVVWCVGAPDEMVAVTAVLGLRGFWTVIENETSWPALI